MIMGRKNFSKIKLTMPGTLSQRPFNYNNFEERVRELKWSNRSDRAEALKKHFEKNLPELKKHFKSIYDIKQLLPYLDESTPFFITQFDPEWLKTLDGFTHLPYIANCLNIFPIENWNIFLNHCYGDSDWFRNHLMNSKTLKKMLNNMYGCANDIEDKCTALLDFLGRDWLRNAFMTSNKLGELLDGYLDEKHRMVVLDFLDGDDHWLDKTFNTYTHLYPLLNNIIDAKKLVPATTEQTIQQVIPGVGSLLKHLNPKWQEHVFCNADEFNNLLNKINKLTINPQQDNTDIFFQLIHALSSINPESNDSEKDKQSTTIDQGFQLIELMKSTYVHHILYDKKSFDKLFSTMNLNKDKPYFKLMLYTMAKAYTYEVAQERPSLFNLLGYTPMEKLYALSNLMKSIANNEPIDASIPAMNSGIIGKISKYYIETYKAESTIKPIKQVDLEKSQPFIF